MTTGQPILVAAGGAGWESGFVAALEQGEHALHVARRCLDVVELLAIAAAGQGRAALVDAQLRRLDADAVDRLLAADVVPIGVCTRADAVMEQRLTAMGIVDLVPSDADPSVIAAVVVEAISAHRAGARMVPSRTARDGAGTGVGAASRPGAEMDVGGLPAAVNLAGVSARRFGDPLASMAISPGSADADQMVAPAGRGSVVAVWGATGAPGRTTVAVSIADELARLGSSTLLVDAEVYGATIAATLGLLDESPGLAAACRQAGNRRLDPEALAALCWQLHPRFRVLTGVPMASRWPELRPAALEAVLATSRAMAAFTVVDCGFCLETDEELSFDTLAPRRNGATLAVLDAADLILVVGAADPIGMQRLVRALSELEDAEVSSPVWVVLNKVRGGVVPGDHVSELTGALKRFANRTPAALLPYDRDSLDRALVTGRSLAEACPTSALRGGMVELAASLAGVPAPAVRSRGWRDRLLPR